MEIEKTTQAWINRISSRFDIPATHIEGQYAIAVSRKRTASDFKFAFLNSLLNETAGKFSGQLLYQKLRHIYAEQFSLLIKEKKNFTHVIRQMHYCDMMSAQDDTYQMKATIIGTKCCDACESQHGKEMLLEEAMSAQPIPYSGCTRELGCICCYGFGVAREVNGRPVKR